MSDTVINASFDGTNCDLFITGSLESLLLTSGCIIKAIVRKMKENRALLDKLNCPELEDSELDEYLLSLAIIHIMYNINGYKSINPEQDIFNLTNSDDALNGFNISDFENNIKNVLDKK